MAFNVFGDLAVDLGLADRVVHTWWPDAPGTVCDVRFEHSRDDSIVRTSAVFARSMRRSCSTSVMAPRGSSASTQVPRRAKREPPKPSNLRRYLEVAERSGAFEAGAIARSRGRPSRRDVARAPAAAVDAPACERHVELGPLRRRPPRRQHGLADACARYRGLLADRSTFSSVTVEELLDANVLPRTRPRPCVSGICPADTPRIWRLSRVAGSSTLRCASVPYMYLERGES